jgi:hypothetical protein
LFDLFAGESEYPFFAQAQNTLDLFKRAHAPILDKSDLPSGFLLYIKAGLQGSVGLSAQARCQNWPDRLHLDAKTDLAVLARKQSAIRPDCYF